MITVNVGFQLVDYAEGQKEFEVEAATIAMRLVHCC